MNGKMSQESEQLLLDSPHVDRDLEFPKYLEARRHSEAQCWTFHGITWAIQCLLLFVSIWMFTMARVLCDCTVKCQNQRHQYEILDAPTDMHTVTWNLTLGKHSQYTSMDKQVTDPAWESISMGRKQGWVKVSEDQMKQIGKLTQSSVAFRDHSGYLAGLEIFHQLHCLNYLRKKTVLYNHLYPASEMEEPVPEEYHIPHCIDAIRLYLQCSSGLSLITQNWVDGWIEPWADWYSTHQCRDFDKIREWATESKAELDGKFFHPELGIVVTDKLNRSALPINRTIRYVNAG